MAWLIAIEGIDGAGKGTQASLLTEALRQRGLQVGQMQFPRYTRTRFGRAIGDFLNGRFGSLEQVHPLLASVLYAGDRFESRGELLDLLATSHVVVLDRFVGSNLAHQSARLNGDARRDLMTWIAEVEFEVFGLPRPDLTLLIDMPTDWSRKLVHRKAPREYTDEAADLHESNADYLTRVRRCYQEIAADRSDWRTLPAVDDNDQLRTVEAIHDAIMQQVETLLSQDH